MGAEVTSAPVEPIVQKKMLVHSYFNAPEKILELQMAGSTKSSAPIKPIPIGARRRCNDVSRSGPLEFNGYQVSLV